MRRSYLCIIIELAICIVVPCVSEALEGRFVNEGLKQDFCFFVGDQSVRGNNLLDKIRTGILVLPQQINSINESRSEFSGTFIKFGNSDSLNVSRTGQLMIETSIFNVLGSVYDHFELAFFGISAFGEVVACNCSDKNSDERSERQASGFDWHTFLYYFGFVCWFLFLGLSVTVITKTFLDKYFPR